MKQAAPPPGAKPGGKARWTSGRHSELSDCTQQGVTFPLCLSTDGGQTPGDALRGGGRLIGHKGTVPRQRDRAGRLAAKDKCDGALATLTPARVGDAPKPPNTLSGAALEDVWDSRITHPPHTHTPPS